MRRKHIIFSLALVFAMILSMASIAVPSFQASGDIGKGVLIGIIGDVDEDSKITVKDATKVQKYVAKILTLTETQQKLADFLLKPGINIKCATYIQKYVAKINLAGTDGEKIGQNSYDKTVVTDTSAPITSTAPSGYTAPASTAPAAVSTTSASAATATSTNVTDPTQTGSTSSATAPKSTTAPANTSTTTASPTAASSTNVTDPTQTGSTSSATAPWSTTAPTITSTTTASTSINVTVPTQSTGPAASTAPTTSPGISPESVKISLKTGYLFMPVTNGTSTLAAAITPSNANQDTSVTWTSSSTAIATVDASGKVTAKSAGDVTITATTANGKKDTFKLRVGADVTSLSFNTDLQPSGPVTYDMKTGQTIPMYLPKITPSNAYSLLTFTSSNTSVVEVLLDSNGDFFLKCKATGTVTITAKSHNNKTASFTISAKAALTGVTINGGASKTMDVNAYWNNIPITLTPSAALPDYTLKVTDPNNANTPSTVLRIEQNKNAYSISPGTARIRVYVDGVEKSSCLVTVSQPSFASTAGLKYYNIVYSALGKATASLGVVPVSGAASYVITEHVNFTSAMTAAQLYADTNVSQRSGDLKINGTTVSRYQNKPYRQWVISSAQATGILNFESVDTGLRFFSIYAMSGANASGSQLGSIFVGRVPVLYYPRNVGGSSESNADGILSAFTMSMYMPSVGNFMLGGDMWLSSGYGSSFLIPTAPWLLQTTFDKIPGASGYTIYAVHNGENFGMVENHELTAIGTNRLGNLSDFVFNNGELILYICPYVIDIDGTKSYGEMRTVTFNVQIGKSTSAKYWEIPSMNNSPSIVFNWK